MENGEHPIDLRDKILQEYESTQSAAQRQNGTDREAYAAMCGASRVAITMKDLLGNNWETISVNIVGHNNKGNKKDPQWANEAITISLTVKEYKNE